MSESIHGHDVMQMMVESGACYTKESLEEAIIAKFGEDALFHTCSAQDMTAKEIIILLESRGKFVGENESFTTEPDRICNHE